MVKRHTRRSPAGAGAPTALFEDEENDDSTRSGRAGHRGPRLERVIERELRSMIEDDVKDPAASRARVVRVELSVDFRNAKVRWTHASRLDSAEVNDVHKGLERCAGFLRAGLAEALGIDRVPLLRFAYDAEAVASDADDQGEDEGEGSPW
jgi:ribosome-binding factor A